MIRRETASGTSGGDVARNVSTKRVSTGRCDKQNVADEEFFWYAPDTGPDSGIWWTGAQCDQSR